MYGGFVIALGRVLTCCRLLVGTGNCLRWRGPRRILQVRRRTRTGQQGGGIRLKKLAQVLENMAGKKVLNSFRCYPAKLDTRARPLTVSTP